MTNTNQLDNGTKYRTTPRGIVATGEACHSCGRTHTPNSSTVAIGRFTSQPRFRSTHSLNAPLRSTRLEAEHDYCQAAQGRIVTI